MVVSFPSVIGPAPFPRRAATVGAIAVLSLASMALGLGLAFPGGIGSRSGAGPRVTSILVTPARAEPAATTHPVTVPAQAGPPIVTPIPATRAPAPPAGPGPTATTPPTPAPDVVNQLNQTVTDVLDLIPAPAGSG